jgi:hypothetical protein
MKSRRLEGKSEKLWDLVCTAASSFICMTGDSMTICFPRKKMTFYFNYPCDLAVGLMSRKM